MHPLDCDCEKCLLESLGIVPVDPTLDLGRDETEREPKEMSSRAYDKWRFDLPEGK
uniref:Uncharacterized protein n=1 Tax=viral metagenome TaxID=1070528 RepID=A0A6M3LCD6_9ZZZZ